MAAAGEWPKDVLDALQVFEQGSIVLGMRFYYYGALTGGLPFTFPAKADVEGETDAAVEPEAEPEPIWDGEPREFNALEWEISDFGVITTQTCDICEVGPPLQPWVQVSPLRLLPTSFTKTPPDFLYPVRPPSLKPGNWVIDLRMEAPIEKPFLVGQTPQSAFANEEERLAFAAALGRRRDRAALPTKLVDAVGQTLRQRRRNVTSFKNALRQEVYQVALNIDEGTQQEPIAVRLHVITNETPSERVKTQFGKWWE